MWEDIYFTEEDIINLMGYEEEYKKRKLAILKDSEELRKKYRDELIKRYSFLYENSFLLLWGISYSVFGANDFLFSLKEKISSEIGKSHFFYNFGESKEFIYLIEEAFLGDGLLEETELYRLVTDIRNKDYYFEDLKKEYDINLLKNDSFHKLDKSFRLLLEAMRLFVEGQGSYKDPYLPFGYMKKKKTKYPNYEKLDVLKVYYDIHDYGLEKMGVLEEIKKFNFDFNLEEDISEDVVPFNGFIHSFAKNYLNHTMEESKNSISDDVKKALYYKYHNVLDWDLSCECISDEEINRPTNTSSCGTKFRINEGDIFFYEDKFYHLCPNCSYIVSINQKVLPDAVRERIKKKYLGDLFIGRKMVLLSEYKSLVKKREN